MIATSRFILVLMIVFSLFLASTAIMVSAADECKYDARGLTYGGPGAHCGAEADPPCRSDLSCLYNMCLANPFASCGSTADCGGGCTEQIMCNNGQCCGRHAYPCAGPRNDPTCCPGFHCDTSNPGAYYCEGNETNVCGDGTVNTAWETCELPNTINNINCSQSTSECFGKKYATRDSFGNCDANCGCTYDPLNFKCVAGHCFAECGSNADCDDLNPHTIDTCDVNACLCKHEQQPYCGDSTVNPGETCELPSTYNNSYCPQTTWECLGTKLGTRDSLGNCDASCGCTNDPFNYKCVKGQCGASCAVDADCDDGNIHTTDTCLANCTCKHETQPYCGDSIVQISEQCELPSTYNNTYCPQTIQQCSGKKLGTRDSYGNCNNTCGCTYDSFRYQCVKDQCGAVCDSNDDCDDQNSHTTDTCNMDSCGCEHTQLPYCGDSIVQLSEQCELPSTYNNTYCPQNTLDGCDGKKTGVRDAYGDCNSECGCTSDPYKFICIPGQCGAECDSNDDCNDLNVHTTDTCLDNCICKHDYQPYCGDGVVNPPTEICELPNTYNNVYCNQSTMDSCSGNKLGTRDGFGNCTNSCNCVYDPFNFVCVPGYCGAECDSDDDCPPSNCSQTFNDYCNSTKLAEYDNDKVKDSTSVTNSTLNTCNSCSTCQCTDNPVSCLPPPINQYCVPGTCGAICDSDDDCNDLNVHTTDTCLANCSCKHETQPYCGDNILNLSLGEQCELPNTYNNTYCPQSDCDYLNNGMLGNGIPGLVNNGDGCDVCDGHKLGTRDHYGDCNNTCSCVYDPYTYACVKGKCGATCTTNADCDDGDSHTTDTCMDNCTCKHECVPYCEDVKRTISYARLDSSCGGNSANVTFKANFSDNIYALQSACSNVTPNYIYLSWYNVNQSHLRNATVFVEHKESDVDAWLEYYNSSAWVKVCDLPERSTDTVDSCNLKLVKGLSNIYLRIGIKRLAVCHEELDQAYLMLKYCYECCSETEITEFVSEPSELVVQEEVIIPPVVHHSSGGGGGGGSSITPALWKCSEWSTCINGKQTRSCTQGTTTKTNSQDCEIIAAATTASSPVEEEAQEQVDETVEAAGEVKTFTLSLGNEKEQEKADANVKPVFEDKNYITGIMAGVSTAVSSLSINWYAVFIILLIIICLPLFFHFVSKK